MENRIFSFSINDLNTGQPCAPVELLAGSQVQQLCRMVRACGQAQRCPKTVPRVVQGQSWCSALQGLFQHVQLLIEFSVLLPLCGYLTNRMQHGGVVPPAKKLTNFRQTFLCHFFGQIHGNLPRSGNAGRAFFAVHVGNFDFVEVSDCLLNVLDTNLPVLDRQQVFQRFTRQANVDFFV